MQTHVQHPTATSWQLFRIWSVIGLQSFGGGASTTFLIQREFIEKRHWMTMEDFTHLWNLCIFAPGINLVALTILIGHRLGSWRGVVSSLIGMLLPSATITCLLAAGFQEVEHLAAIQAIIKGVIPATSGIMLLVGLRFAQPQFKIARQGGWSVMVVSLALVIVCFISIALLNISVALVLVCAGLLGIVLFTRPWKREESVARD